MINKILDAWFGSYKYEVRIFFEGSLAKWSDGIPDAARNDTLQRNIDASSQKYRELLAVKQFRTRTAAVTWGEGKCTGLKSLYFFIKVL